MIQISAPIIPMVGLGGLHLGEDLLKSGSSDWTTVGPEFPWEVSWIDRGPPEVKQLTPYVETSKGVVAFIDGHGVIQALAATPNYQGLLFDVVKPGLTGREILRILPKLRYRDLDASLWDDEQPGYFFKHSEFDLDLEDFLAEPCSFIFVYRPGFGYFE